jgi:mRNA-degrading endonuclease RelE of RelBE toxin-antitoxin system
MHALVYRSRFLKGIKRLDRPTQAKLIEELERLAVDPWQHPNVRRLVGSVAEAYRLRVGRWRILYLLIQENRTIEVIDLFMKKSKTDYQRRSFY